MKSIVAALLISVIAPQVHAETFLFCEWVDAKHVRGLQPEGWIFDGDLLRQTMATYVINRDSVLSTLQVMARTDDSLELQFSTNPTATPRIVIDLRTGWATRPHFANAVIPDHGICALHEHALDGNPVD